MPLRRGLTAPFALAAFALGLPTATASAAPLTLEPKLLQQLDATTDDSRPGFGVTIGAASYFTADDGVHGTELFATDGTAAGTRLVKDVTPGTDGTSFGSKLVAAGTTAYFVVDGNGLWKSDGTAAGTTEVLDLGNDQVEDLVAVGTAVFFSTYSYGDEDEGVPASAKLWKTDGTGAGTDLLHTFAPDRNAVPRDLTRVGTSQTIVFSATETGTGNELWRSDGTPDGTQLVADQWSGAASAMPDRLAAVGDVVAYATHNGSTYNQVWTTDGTAAAPKPIATLGADASISNLTDVDGVLYFVGNSLNTTGREVWRSDLTPGNARQVTDLRPGPQGSDPSGLTAFGGELFYTASNGVDGYELFRTDGTTTTMLEIDADGEMNANVVGVAGDRLVLTADDGQTGRELWATTADGTPTLVQDVVPGAAGLPNSVSQSLALGDTLLMRLDDGVHGAEVWRTDGTGAGTALLSDVRAGKEDNDLRDAATAGGRVFFTGWTPATGRELYVTDGTAGGSHMVADLEPGAGDADISGVTAAGDRVFFASNAGGSAGLWRSDGTAAGTVRVAALPSTDNELEAVGSTVYVRSGRKLIVSDGTAAGTREVGASLSFQQLGLRGSVGGKLLFSAYGSQDQAYGSEMFVSDGTDAGTLRLADLNPGSPGSWPSEVTQFDGKAYFLADAPSGRDLFVTDGTPEGTELAVDITPGAANTWAGSPVAFDGALYLPVSAGDGSELWKVTGDTAARVVDVRPSGDDYVHGLIASGDTLFFFGRNQDGEHRLFGTDGTAAGTVDLARSDNYYDHRRVLALDGRLFFGGDTNLAPNRNELWVSDGTPAGTGAVASVESTGDGSRPEVLGAFGKTVVFSAYTPSAGRAAYAIDLAAPSGGTNPGGGTGPGTGTGPSTGTGTDPGTGPGTNPGGAPNPGAGPTPGPGTNPGAGTNPGGGKGGATPGRGKGGGLDAPYSGPPRPAPTSLTLVKPARVQRDTSLPYRFAFGGRLGVPKGVSKKAACKGEVVATVKRGSRTIKVAEGRVKADCTYRVVVKITSLKGLSRRGGKLDVALRFAGNTTLRPMNAGAATVRYGG